MPTLVHDGPPVIESTVINEYLDEVFAAPPLKPADTRGGARIRLWTKVPDEEIHIALASVSVAAAFAKQLQREFPPEVMENALTDGPWLAGQNFSLADVALTPYLDRLNRLGLAPIWAQAPPRFTD